MKYLNLISNSFFRSIGRILAYILIFGVIGYILSEWGVIEWITNNAKTLLL